MATTLPTISTIISDTLEEISIDKRKRDKSPITYAIKDTASFLGSISHFGSLAMDDMVQDKVLENKLNAKSRLKDFEIKLLELGY